MHARLDRSTSVYLNAVRFLAALIVFLGHISGHRFTAGFLWPFAAFMDMAVMIFFVLSGFVIAYVTEDHERDLRTYSINRMARIYSVAAPALLLAFVLDAIGRHLKPELYSASWGFSSNAVWLQYLASAFFVQRIWWTEINPGSIMPYWSLGFEVWYYIIFGAFFFLRGSSRLILGMFACFCAGPVILSLFPVWLLGFLTYYISKKYQMQKWAAWTVVYATVAGLAVMMYLEFHHFNLPRTVGVRYVYGLIFATNIIAIRRIGISDRFLGATEKPIGWLSGMTFSLYLFHVPVAQFLTTIVPWAPQNALTRVIMLAGTFLIIILLAEVTERRKNVWRKLISSMIDSLFGPPVVEVLKSSA